MFSKNSLFRDVWGLGVPNAGYPGAFPQGLIPRIKRRWWGQKRLWLFSGSFKDPLGTTVDIKPELEPDYICNCEELPFEDESFDFVMADPPYSKEEAKKLYNLPYVNVPKTMNEMARVCKPEGHVLFLHRLIPWYFPTDNAHVKRLRPVAIIGVYTLAGYTNIRALTIWRKHETLAAYFSKKEVD